MLQTRQQFELEKFREQGREQERQAQLQHQQEISESNMHAIHLYWLLKFKRCNM